MKNKKIAMVLVIVLLILIISGGTFYLGKNYSKKNIKPNISSFLYSNSSDILPQDKRITWDYYSNNFLKLENENEYSSPRNKLICVSTGKEPVNVNLFTEKIQDCAPNINGCQGAISRNVEVCGNQYIIVEPWLSGPQFYGVFELK